MVFDAPRTAALQSCLLRTEGSGLGSLTEPPVVGINFVKRRVDCETSDKYEAESNCVKFTIGDSSDDEEEDWPKFNSFSRQKSEGSSGVSTRLSTTMSNASSSFASSFSGIDYDLTEDDDRSVDSAENKSLFPLASSVATNLPLFDAKLISDRVIVEQSNVLCTRDGENTFTVAMAHLHEKSYLRVHPVPAVEIEWQHFVCGKFLVFNIPVIAKAVGIQEALITLLEYGENNLHCSNAVVLIETGRSDKTSLERMFAFLGFHFAVSSELPKCLQKYLDDYVVMVTDFSDLCDDSDDNESLFDE